LTPLQAIAVRKSRRTYNNIPLTEHEIQVMNNFIEAYNIQASLSFQFITNRPELFGGFLKSYGMLSGVINFIVVAGPSNDPNLFEKLGYYGELLVLEATRLDLGTCWVGGSFDKNSVQQLVAPSDTLVAVIAIGNVEGRFSPKESFIRGLTHLKKTANAKFIATDGSQPEWFETAIDAIAKAPSAVNQQPVVFVVKNSVITAKLRIHNYFSPVDFGIAKAHFQLASPGGTWSWGETGTFKLN
jgi:hypothetical protein